MVHVGHGYFRLPSHNEGMILERITAGSARVYIREYTHAAAVPREFLWFFVRFPRPGCVRWLARGARNNPLSSPLEIDINSVEESPAWLRPCHHFRHACCTRVHAEEQALRPTIRPNPLLLFFVIHENHSASLTRDDSPRWIVLLCCCTTKHSTRNF